MATEENHADNLIINSYGQPHTLMEALAFTSFISSLPTGDLKLNFRNTNTGGIVIIGNASDSTF